MSGQCRGQILHAHAPQVEASRRLCATPDNSSVDSTGLEHVYVSDGQSKRRRRSSTSQASNTVSCVRSNTAESLDDEKLVVKNVIAHVVPCVRNSTAAAGERCEDDSNWTAPCVRNSAAPEVPAVGTKRTAESSVLDLAINAWDDVVTSICDSDVERASGSNSLFFDQRMSETWHETEHRERGSDANAALQTHPASAIGEHPRQSRATRRIEELREHILGRVIGKMSRLEGD